MDRYALNNLKSEKKGSLNSPYTWFSVIAFGFFLVQLFVINYVPFGPDEFWFAHHIYQYKFALPYRDFLPYKTVLGYYTLLPSFYLSKDIIAPLFYIKYELNVINSLCVFIAMAWLSKWYNWKAVCLAMILCISTPFFFRYFNELRVDALTSWMGFFSFLFFLDKKNIKAGLLAGLSFLFSQKGIYFFVATNFAMLVGAVRFSDYKPKFMEFIKYNLTALIVLLLYILYFSLESGLSTVLESVFVEAYQLSTLSLWNVIWKDQWIVFLEENPLFFILIVVSLICFDKQDERDTSIVLCALIFLFFALINTQPWAYSIASMVTVFMASNSMLFSNIERYAYPRWIYILILIVGIGIQVNAYRFYYIINNNYQLQVIRLLDTIVTNEQGYFAGTPLLYNRDQAVAGLRNLISPSLWYLSEQKSQYLKGLRLSLLNVPTTESQAIEQLKDKHAFYYVNNYRILNLPEKLQQALKMNYKHFWSSIYTKGNVNDLQKKYHKSLNKDIKQDKPLYMLQAILWR